MIATEDQVQVDQVNNIELVEYPLASDGSKLSVEQRNYLRQVNSRSLSLACQSQYLAAHTILLRNRNNFLGFELCDLEYTVDAVLTTCWVRGKYGEPRLGLCFRIYQPEYDETTNTVYYGGADRCVFAKDGSCMPFSGATGRIFDYEKNPINFNNFLAMDAEIEACVRDSDLMSDGPVFTDCLVIFEVGSNPLYNDVMEDINVSNALLDEVMRLVQPGSTHPDWVYGPNAKITDIVKDEEFSATVVVFDNEEVVELPLYARLAPDTKIGNTPNPDLPLADIHIDSVRSLDQLLAIVGPNDLNYLKSRVWNSANLKQDDLICIPNRFVSQSFIVEKAMRDDNGKVRIIRDLSNVLGREYHNPKDPSIFDESFDEAPINVWYMGGLASKERLTFDYFGHHSDFSEVKLQWRGYF